METRFAMDDSNLGPLNGRTYWFLPIAPIEPVGSVCLPGSPAADEVHHPDGRSERIPEPFCHAATVLVFETPEDASKYFVAYTSDTQWRSQNLAFDTSAFSIARMSPQQVADNFHQRSPGALWHVPVPVHHEWAGEVIDALEQRGIPPSTTVATERLTEFLARPAG